MEMNKISKGKSVNQKKKKCGRISKHNFISFKQKRGTRKEIKGEQAQGWKGICEVIIQTLLKEENVEGRGTGHGR